MNNGYFFIVVCWGERYRNYFLDYCLPSLLAPGNIPALENKAKSKFLICTTDADWPHIKAHRATMLLEQHIEAVHIRIPPSVDDGLAQIHMGKGHTAACRYVHQRRGCVMMLQPDTLISDGAIVRLQELHAQGKRLVICPAVRFDERRLIANLGIGKAPCLAIGASNLAEAARLSLHPETAAYQWDAPYATTIFPIVWWVVGNAMIVHAVSWEPLLLDYSCGPDEHDETTIEKSTIDRDYLNRNFKGSLEQIHIVRSTDEICFVSFTPANEGPQWPYVSIFKWGRLRRWVRQGQLCRMMASDQYLDELKLKLFAIPVVWGGSVEWEGYSNTVVDKALAGGRRCRPIDIMAETMVLMWIYRWKIAKYLGLSLIGDVKSMRSLGYATRHVLRSLR